MLLFCVFQFIEFFASALFYLVKMHIFVCIYGIGAKNHKRCTLKNILFFSYQAINYSICKFLETALPMLES